MQIKNITQADFDLVLAFYDAAVAFQKTRFSVHWHSFDKEMLQTEIEEKRQWQLLIEGEVACIWAITFEDPLIWEEKNSDPSVYIHRIATNPKFRGQNLVEKIVQWAKNYAKMNEKQFVRLDTVGENHKLIEYYQRSGFTFLGLLKLKNTKDLPQHYDNATVSLFEIKV
jgi:ribosomal protein S18 acetylase RimI-like enzyme